MARRTYGRRAARRKLDWEVWGIQAQTTVTTVDTNVAIVLHSQANVAFVNNGKWTLTRMIGDLWLRQTNAAVGIVHMCVVIRSVSGGAAQSINPASEEDMNLPNILWRASFMGDNADSRATRFHIDIKAQRIMNERADIALVLRSSVQPGIAFVAGRSLWKLA